MLKFAVFSLLSACEFLAQNEIEFNCLNVDDMTLVSSAFQAKLEHALMRLQLA